MERKPYPSDLSDAEWEMLAPLLPTERQTGSPRRVEIREVLNAVMYVADNGIKWRALPHDFPAWQTVYGYFRRWTQSGVWEEVTGVLNRAVRVQAGREVEPSLGLLDSQSVAMAQKGALSRESMATRRSKGVSATF
jgi:transposase